MKKLILLIAVFTTSLSNASVWEVEKEWNAQAELDYQNWIRSDAVHRRIFLDGGTPLAQLSTDCADALYAIRIYFAWKNKLPFAMHAPNDYDSSLYQDVPGQLSQISTKFDNITDPVKRLRAFLKYVSKEAGTLNLTRDTFPVSIASMNSGDIYVVRWSFLGESFRHSYFIKNIDRKGNVLLYWSNAPRKIQKLRRTKKYSDYAFEGAPFGYRRWRQPQHIGIDQSLIPPEFGYSEEQYQLLRQVGPRKILKAIRKRLRTR